MRYVLEGTERASGKAPVQPMSATMWNFCSDVSGSELRKARPQRGPLPGMAKELIPEEEGEVAVGLVS